MLTTNALLKARVRACAVHFTASTFIVGTLALITLTIWYPQGLASLQGVLPILGLVAVVDVVLGPALTFIVFTPGKRTLKFDLSIIVAIQLAALAYGSWTIASQKPEYLVYLYDRFFVVRSGDLLGPPPADLEKLPRWKGGPRVVFVRLSLSAQLQSATSVPNALDTPATGLLPGGYAPLQENLGQLILWDLRRTGRADDDKARIPVLGRVGEGEAVLDLRGGNILKIVATH